MRGWWRSSAATIAAVLLACGSSGNGGKSQPAPGNGPDPGGDGTGEENGTVDPSCGGHVTVRLLGTNAGTGISALSVEPGALEVTSGSALVVTGATAGALDLVQAQAYRLGIVTPPAGATAATAVFPITAAHVAGTALTGDLEVCTAPVEFTFDPARVRPPACHVVVELDLARSVHPALCAGGSPFLLPQFRVVY
jgi:hypothetical protein